MVNFVILAQLETWLDFGLSDCGADAMIVLFFSNKIKLKKKTTTKFLGGISRLWTYLWIHFHNFKRLSFIVTRLGRI